MGMGKQNCKYCKYYSTCCFSILIKAENKCLDFKDILDDVGIVRCKDCKEWLRNRGVVDSPNGHCFYHETHMNGYDFCSYGEREDNG